MNELELNKDFSLKGFKNWLNADESRKRGLTSGDKFMEIGLEKNFKDRSKLTKRSKRFGEIYMKSASRAIINGNTNKPEPYAEVFLEGLAEQKVEDENRSTREVLEELIKIKEKELQELKEKLKRIN